MLSEEKYNEANALFRESTNQQKLMVESALKNFTSVEQSSSLTSYGCGFGMFELALIEKLPQDNITFYGCDINEAALELLSHSLKSQEKVDDFTLQQGSTEVVMERFPKTAMGVSVQSLFYHEKEVAEEIIRWWATQHEKFFLALTPLNELNKPFNRTLLESGMKTPAFAEVVEEILLANRIEFVKEIIPARITIPKNISAEDLNLLLSFIVHEKIDSFVKEELFEKIRELSDYEEAVDSFLLPHPVHAYVF